MPVLNYTTTISRDKTIAEITGRLADHGASRIATDYANGQPTGLTFVMPNPETGPSSTTPCRSTWRPCTGSWSSNWVGDRGRPPRSSRPAEWRGG